MNLLTFKTVSEFKKNLKVGVKVKATFHLDRVRGEDGKITFADKDMGIRPISIVQTNSFAMKTTKADGKITDSWCQYPKASECKILDDNTLEIYEGTTKVLTYQLIAE